MARDAVRECGAKSEKYHCEDRVNSARSITAAEDSARISIWQTVLNVAGIAGLAATVFYARGAWLAARDSADADNKALRAARESLQHARQVAEADQRPWIVQELLVRSVSVGPSLIKIDGAIRSKNVGKTVARVAMTGHQELFGLTTAGRSLDQHYTDMDGFITSSYILPGQQIEAELLSFTFRGKDGEDNADSDPSKAFLQITIATKYTGAESGDYLTSETFMITKRSGPGGKNQEGFYLHDADDFLPNRLHIEPQPQKGRVR